MENIAFITDGGKGTRLWDTLPQLKTGKVSKGLTIKIKVKPIIYHTLIKLKKTGIRKVFITLLNKNIEDSYHSHISSGLLLKLSYRFLYVPYEPSFKIPQLLGALRKSSLFKEPWKKVVMSDADIYFDGGLKKSFFKDDSNIVFVKDIEKRHINCNIKNMGIVYNSENILKEIKLLEKPPKEILEFPFILNRNAFELYSKKITIYHKRDFVTEALKKGYKFSIYKPNFLINVNTSEDLMNLKKLLTRKESAHLTS